MALQTFKKNKSMMHSKKSERYPPTHFGSVERLYHFPNATDFFSTKFLTMEGCTSFYAVLLKHSGKGKYHREISISGSKYLLPQT